MPHTNEYFPDFDHLLRWRREHYAGWDPSRAPRRSRAVITIVRDEADLLPIWLRYYSRFFDADDIYVLDHDTVDGSTSGPGFHRIPVSHPTFDVAWLLEQVRGLQHELSRRYDVVVVCDVDEIIAPDPASSAPDLGVYLDRFDEEFVSCLGYEVLHRPDREPPIDLSKPLLAQRGWWFRNPIYVKPLIASVPMEWVPGLHRRLDGENNYDPELRLIHLHRLDVERCFERHLHMAAIRHAERDVDSGLGWHNRITERADFDTWFHNLGREARTSVVLEPIGPRWHSVI
jgi:hypothetical protein